MRTFLAPVALTVLALSLAGCTVSIADPEGTDAAPAPRSSAAEPSPTRSTPMEADPEDTSTGAALTRDGLIAAASTTLSCTPELVISQTAAAVRVEGACESVTVSADAAVVVVDDVKRLRVTGAGTVVSALAVDEVTVIGDANTVWWRGDAPVVSDTGVGNRIARER